MKIIEFLDRESLEEHLYSLNYDQGLTPEMACIDRNQQMFLACGTDQGDAMGIAYYGTSAEGYMHHYGVEYDGDRSILDWKPQFPVQALAPTEETKPRSEHIARWGVYPDGRPMFHDGPTQEDCSQCSPSPGTEES